MRQLSVSKKVSPYLSGFSVWNCRFGYSLIEWDLDFYFHLRFLLSMFISGYTIRQHLLSVNFLLYSLLYAYSKIMGHMFILGRVFIVFYLQLHGGHRRPAVRRIAENHFKCFIACLGGGSETFDRAAYCRRVKTWLWPECMWMKQHIENCANDSL